MKGRVPIYYLETGTSDDRMLVFLHGGGVSNWMWEEQIAYFSNNYYILVPDLPGHGKSADQTTFSIDSSAERVAEIIEKKADGREVILCGFSLGAQVSLDILRLSPNLADRAMINSALVKPMPLAAKWVKPGVAATAFLIKNRQFARLQAKELSVGAEQFERYFEDSRNMAPEVLVQVLEENMSFALTPDLEKAKAKVLVTVGGREKTMMKQSARIILNSVSIGEGLIFNRCKHGAPLADPLLFNRTLEAWLKDEPFPAGISIINKEE